MELVKCENTTTFTMLHWDFHYFHWNGEGCTGNCGWPSLQPPTRIAQWYQTGLFCSQISSDEFELKFPELSWAGISILGVKLSWQNLYRQSTDFLGQYVSKKCLVCYIFSFSFNKMTVWFDSSCIFQEGSTSLLRARIKSGKLMKVVSHNPNDDTT